MKNIVILISGGGSNMLAIVRAAEQGAWAEKFGVRVALVVSNRPDAKGLQLAQSHAIETRVVDHKAFASRQAFETALASVISTGASAPNSLPDLVVLAGFMRILSPSFVSQFEGRIVNIHPSLLPAFTGLNTHQRAIDAGCKVSGVTVHQVTAELDVGPILAQAVVPILPGDTAVLLAARILTQEHLIYPKALVHLLCK